MPTHLGVEEYTNYSRHYGIISLGLGFFSHSSLPPTSPQHPPPPAMAGRPPAPSLPLSSFPPLPPPLLRARGALRRARWAPPPPSGPSPPLLQQRCAPWEARGRPTPRLRWPQPPAEALPARAARLLLPAQISPCRPPPPPPPLRARAQGARGEPRPPPLLPSAPLLPRTPPLLALARGARAQGAWGSPCCSR